MPRPIVLVKLGGSLITDKTRPGVARVETIRRLAREIAARARAPRGALLVIGHGSGSFGHVAARAGGFDAPGTRGRVSPAAIARTQRHAAALHAIVLEALDDAGARPFSLAPSSFLEADGGRIAGVFAGPLFRALELGLLPVVYGDVVVDRARGASIVSTETVFIALAREAIRRRRAIARAVWLGETDGVLAPDGTTRGRVTAAGAARLARRVTGAAGTDVTGGMALRLRTAATLARAGVPSLIVDGRPAGALARAVAGRARGGTRVDAP